MNEIFDLNNLYDEDDEKEINEAMSRRYNKKLLSEHKALQKIDEKVIYDKKFLLEVQNSGYDPLDKEDVQNFLEKKLPKNLNRNLILAGVGKYDMMGQSEYTESDVSHFLKNNQKTNIQTKKPSDIYLSDIPDIKEKQLLVENEEIDFTSPTQNELNDLKQEHKNLSTKDIEDRYREHLAECLGSKEYIKKDKEKRFEQNTNQDLIRSNYDPEKILKLIKELRSLGYTPEEIKQELKKIK